MGKISSHVLDSLSQEGHDSFIVWRFLVPSRVERPLMACLLSKGFNRDVAYDMTDGAGIMLFHTRVVLLCSLFQLSEVFSTISYGLE